MHSYNDQPIISPNGDKTWYYKDKIHRETKDENENILPACIDADGFMSWYKHGELHRDEKDKNGKLLPAVIDRHGEHYYYLYGKSCVRIEMDVKPGTRKLMHSYNDQPIISLNGDKTWYYKDKIHRETRDSHGNILPACIGADGFMSWYKHGKLHRDEKDRDGNPLPAVIDRNGERYYYLHGEYYYIEMDEDGKPFLKLKMTKLVIIETE